MQGSGPRKIRKSGIGFHRSSGLNGFVRREQMPGRGMKSKQCHNQSETGPMLGLLRRMVITFALSMIALTGCSLPQAESGTYRNPNELLRKEDIAALNALANNPATAQAERARAVFALFSQHLQPGCSAAEVRRVLTDPTWLKEARLQGFRDSGGQTPIEMTAEDTVFGLHLFPTQAQPRSSPWVIYFRLSGRHDQDEVARDFLMGESGHGNPRMLEFALCLNYAPGKRELHGRMERVSSKGLHVFEEW